MDEHKHRREWFASYVERIEQGVIKPPEPGARYPCPCCGYPTLYERGGYEICPLCEWEDDGQDDPHADEVWGGPNKRYSLSQARENFERYLVMYIPEDDTRIGGRDTSAELEAKRAIIAAFDSMENETAQSRIDSLWLTIEENQQVLGCELASRIRRYEANSKAGKNE